MLGIADTIIIFRVSKQYTAAWRELELMNIFTEGAV